MMRLCPGTLITILYQARAQASIKYKNICQGIFTAYGSKLDNYSNSLPSHLRSGQERAPADLIDAALEFDQKEISEKFKKYVLCNIANNKRVAVVLAIREVLKEDPIDGETEIGYEGVTKNSILNHDTFCEEDLLVSVFRYAFVSTDNKEMKESIKEIPKDLVEKLTKSKEKIYLTKPIIEQDDIVPLKRTMKDPLFDRIFKKGPAITITGITNPSIANMYYLEPMNCRFRFRDMKELLLDNIGNYVFSRAYSERLMSQNKANSAIGARALRKFEHKYRENIGNVLGELLLYVFLEQALDAPKIMSKLELSESCGGFVSKSDGVHLLSKSAYGMPYHQIVFGASDIDGNLLEAIDRAFEKIGEVQDNCDNELRLISTTAQNAIYGKEATEFMVKLMIPQRDGQQRTELAYGVFLGYSIKLDEPELNSQKYPLALSEQLSKDIQNAVEYIKTRICEFGLEGYSLYFYVLPFNDAEKERTSIIQEFMEEEY